MARLITIHSASQMLWLLSGIICTLMNLCLSQHWKGNEILWNINWDPKQRWSIINPHCSSVKELTTLEMTGRCRFLWSALDNCTLADSGMQCQHPQPTSPASCLAFTFVLCPPVCWPLCSLCFHTWPPPLAMVLSPFFSQSCSTCPLKPSSAVTSSEEFSMIFPTRSVPLSTFSWHHLRITRWQAYIYLSHFD